MTTNDERRLIVLNLGRYQRKDAQISTAIYIALSIVARATHDGKLQRDLDRLPHFEHVKAMKLHAQAQALITAAQVNPDAHPFIAYRYTQALDEAAKHSEIAAAAREIDKRPRAAADDMITADFTRWLNSLK